MEAAPRQMVWSAAAVLAGVAVLGLYLGIHRGGPGPGDFSETTVAAGASGHPARAAAEPAPPLPALDETQVRQIARQEAEALLTHPHTAAPKHAKADDTADDSGGSDQTDSSGSNSDQGAAPATPSPTPTPTPAPAAGPPD